MLWSLFCVRILLICCVLPAYYDNNNIADNGNIDSIAVPRLRLWQQVVFVKGQPPHEAVGIKIIWGIKISKNTDCLCRRHKSYTTEVQRLGYEVKGDDDNGWWWYVITSKHIQVMIYSWLQLQCYVDLKNDETIISSI